MKNREYRPEGVAPENYDGAKALIRAMNEKSILQARCLMCDQAHNLHLKVGGIDAVIPRDETALGIREGTVGDVAIITRVNKTVAFKVREFDGERAVLSRVDAQRECLEYICNSLTPGDVIDAKITHLEQFGAFCDLGCGIVSMIPIDSISVSRIDHPAARFLAGMDVKVVIKEIDKQTGRISVSHKELLGTWEQNAKKFSPGQTVPGIVRSIESYGIFIELLPNLAGLSELTPGIEAGDRVSVYIKSIIPEKMKVKLAIVDSIKGGNTREPFEYIHEGEHIDRWRYSPKECKKTIETVF